jgi:hypothetical protein
MKPMSVVAMPVAGQLDTPRSDAAFREQAGDINVVVIDFDAELTADEAGGRHEHGLAARSVAGNAERGVCGCRGGRRINRKHAVARAAESGDEEVGRVVRRVNRQAGEADDITVPRSQPLPACHQRR